MVNPIPNGYHTVTPYLTIRGATELLAFTKAAFGAEEVECIKAPDGRVMHAEIKIGDSRVMMGEAGDTTPPMPCTLYLYVDDVDAWFQRAKQADAEVIEELEDKFYGDRTAAVRDAQGNRWYMATHIEDFSSEELDRRAQAAMAAEAAGS